MTEKQAFTVGIRLLGVWLLYQVFVYIALVLAASITSPHGAFGSWMSSVPQYLLYAVVGVYLALRPGKLVAFIYRND